MPKLIEIFNFGKPKYRIHEPQPIPEDYRSRAVSFRYLAGDSEEARKRKRAVPTGIIYEDGRWWLIARTFDKDINEGKFALERIQDWHDWV